MEASKYWAASMLQKWGRELVNWMGARESGDGEFLPSGKYLVLGEVIKEWGFQRQPQG